MVGPNDSLPQPEDVTGVIAFLCGPESKFINGALIPIDGGYMCKWIAKNTYRFEIKYKNQTILVIFIYMILYIWKFDKSIIEVILRK